MDAFLTGIVWGIGFITGLGLCACIYLFWDWAAGR